jgi:hypothetical protein
MLFCSNGLQKYDSPLGGLFFAQLHAYNYAGHYCSVKSVPIGLPSLLPPASGFGKLFTYQCMLFCNNGMKGYNIINILPISEAVLHLDIVVVMKSFPITFESYIYQTTLFQEQYTHWKSFQMQTNLLK